MADSQADDPLLRFTRRGGRWLTQGRVSPDEFTHRLFDEFPGDRRAPLHLASSLLDSITEAARDAFVGRVREAVAPDFRRQPFLYGGAEPVSADKLHQEADEQTARVRAWATEFRRLLDDRPPIDRRAIGAAAQPAPPDPIVPGGCDAVEMNPYTVNDVIAGLDSLHGNVIRVSGVLQLEFEARSLWHSPTRERRPNYESSLWAEFDHVALGRSPDQLRPFNARHVIVGGTADRQMTGHLGLWPGGLLIRDITKAKVGDGWRVGGRSR
jgi:hypothetical protein